MPVNRKHNLESLLGALREAFPAAERGRKQERVFFEYVMLDGVNDSEADLARLVAIQARAPWH